MLQFKCVFVRLPMLVRYPPMPDGDDDEETWYIIIPRYKWHPFQKDSEITICEHAHAMLMLMQHAHAHPAGTKKKIVQAIEREQERERDAMNRNKKYTLTHERNATNVVKFFVKNGCD